MVTNPSVAHGTQTSILSTMRFAPRLHAARHARGRFGRSSFVPCVYPARLHASLPRSRWLLGFDGRRVRRFARFRPEMSHLRRRHIPCGSESDPEDRDLGVPAERVRLFGGASIAGRAIELSSRSLQIFVSPILLTTPSQLDQLSSACGQPLRMASASHAVSQDRQKRRRILRRLFSKMPQG